MACWGAEVAKICLRLSILAEQGQMPDLQQASQGLFPWQRSAVLGHSCSLPWDFLEKYRICGSCQLVLRWPPRTWGVGSWPMICWNPLHSPKQWGGEKTWKHSPSGGPFPGLSTLLVPSGAPPVLRGSGRGITLESFFICQKESYEGGPQKTQNLFVKNCVFILTCLNCSLLQSTFHLMLYTYQEVFSTAQNSVWTHQFCCLLVLLPFFVSPLPQQ